jgi:hypothetical protein
MMNDQLGRIWKEILESKSKYYRSVCLEGVRKRTVILRQGSNCPGRDCNRAPTEYKYIRPAFVSSGVTAQCCMSLRFSDVSCYEKDSGVRFCQSSWTSCFKREARNKGRVRRVARSVPVYYSAIDEYHCST